MVTVHFLFDFARAREAYLDIIHRASTGETDRIDAAYELVVFRQNIRDLTLWEDDDEAS